MPSYDYKNMYNDSEEEIGRWVDLPGFPNHQGSITGQIRNKKRKNILKPHIDKDGYCVMSLGSVDNVKVHRVLCEAFHGPSPDKKTQVNHIDCDRQNNNFLNLEWSTPSENIKWSVRKGNIDPIKASRKASESNLKPIRITETGEVFDSVQECASYLGVIPTNISRVLVGDRKGQKIHGYHLEYLEKGV